MSTIANTTNASWANQTAPQPTVTTSKKFIAWADAQAPNRTLWFMVSLIAQGVLFLPVPAVLLFYFNAPIGVLAITLGLFFSNIIAGMGGAGIRAMLALFALSIVVHLLMVLAFTI